MSRTCTLVIALAVSGALCSTVWAQPRGAAPGPKAPTGQGQAAPPNAKPAPPNAKPAPPNAKSTEPAIDPQAVDALRRMGAFLRDQRSFIVKTKSATDQVLGSGEKVQLLSQGELKVARPDRLRAEVVSDRRHRQYFYDGKTFTMNGPSTGYYASVPAPPTLGELVQVVDERYGIELPLVDLFYWGTEKEGVDQLELASVIGPSKIDGVETDHFAFRQAGLDWQIWIERGPRPLPRRLVMTTLDDPARPQHVVEMTWALGAKLDPKQFAFVPPKGSHKIDFETVVPPRSAAADPAKR